MRRGWTVMYSDGAGNVFRFAGHDDGASATVCYDPVVPAQSSSGTYSGGARKESTLDPSARAELWRLLETLEATPEQHAQHRRKGTGEITLHSSEHSGRSFIIQPGPGLEELESFVSSYRG